MNLDNIEVDYMAMTEHYAIVSGSEYRSICIRKLSAFKESGPPISVLGAITVGLVKFIINVVVNFVKYVGWVIINILKESKIIADVIKSLFSFLESGPNVYKLKKTLSVANHEMLDLIIQDLKNVLDCNIKDISELSKEDERYSVPQDQESKYILNSIYRITPRYVKKHMGSYENIKKGYIKTKANNIIDLKNKSNRVSSLDVDIYLDELNRTYREYNIYLEKNNLNKWAKTSDIKLNYSNEARDHMIYLKESLSALKDVYELTAQYLDLVSDEANKINRELKILERKANSLDKFDELAITSVEKLLPFIIKDIKLLTDKTNWIKNEIVTSILEIADTMN